MKVISTPVAAVRYGAVHNELHERQCDHTDAGTPRERSRGGENHQENPDRDRCGDWRCDDDRADEGQDAATADELGEDRKRVADHRRTTGHVRKPPHTVIGEEDTETGGDESLGDIADEDRHRRHPPHGLPRRSRNRGFGRRRHGDRPPNGVRQPGLRWGSNRAGTRRPPRRERRPVSRRSR